MFRVLCFLFLLQLVGCGEREAEDYEIWGLDVSHHQREVDWGEVAKCEHPDFVFIKVSEGTIIKDRTYDRHRKELEDAGVLWGGYHFFGHRTSGRDQARQFIKTARLERGNLIPVLDIEWSRLMKDPKRSAREAKLFCDEIYDYYGVNPIIYSSINFYHSYLEETFPEGEYVLWMADYRGQAPNMNWQFWQHTESYKIKGISGRVDRNVFKGSRSELQKLILR